MSQSQLLQPKLTKFDFRQMFDFTKIESFAMKRELNVHARNHKTYLANLEYRYKQGGDNSYRSTLDGLLLKKDKQELERCILKSELNNFKSLPDIDRHYCTEHLLEQVYLIALGQNNLFIAKYDKYMQYREILMEKAIVEYFTNPKDYESIPSGFYFRKSYKKHGLYRIAFKRLLAKDSNNKSSHDYRFGISYEHYWGTGSKATFVDPIKFANYIQVQSEILDKVYFQTYIAMIDKMIEDGISEEDARKAFPKP